MGKIKLRMLKAIFMVAFKILSRTKSKLALPAKWLLHYLRGSGEDMAAPSHVVREAVSAISLAVVYHARNAMACSAGDIKSGRYCLNHSTLYKGCGFYGRPTLFYLVGGFSFTYEDGTVKGVDRYDWHPTASGEYFTSPLGSSWWMNLIVRCAGVVFGRQYFVANGFPSGETGISNRLWEAFELVGAKPFNTIVELSGGIEDVIDEAMADLDDQEWEWRSYGHADAQAEAREEEFFGKSAVSFLSERSWLSVSESFISQVRKEESD